MLRVTAGAGRRLGTVTLSPNGRQLLLQAELRADAARFDADLEAFFNEIDYWKAVVEAR